MSRTAGKRAPCRQSYTAAEWELLNDFAAYLVHCDLKDAQAADQEPDSDGKVVDVDT